MKAKFLAIAMACLAVCTASRAQQKVGSLIVGYSPVGYIHESVSLDDEKYKYDYKSYMNVSLGYERQFKGAVTLSELTYARGKFDEYDLTGTSQWFNPAQQKDIFSVVFTQYFGTTINANKRVQFPVYFGIGGNYINGGPFHNLTIDGAAKFRVKFYFSGNFGIYAGITGRIGWGAKSASEESSNNSNSYNIVNTSWAADAGIVIGI